MKPVHVRVLEKIEAGASHALQVAELDPVELIAAASLCELGLARLLPAGHTATTDSRGRGHTVGPVPAAVAHRFPSRFAVTATGSHRLGTFAMDAENFELEVFIARREAKRTKAA